MLDQRRNLIEERRRAAAATKRQKETITKVMEEVRSNASKATHLVTSAMMGTLSIHDIASGKDIFSASRSKSAEKKEGKKSKTTADLLSLDRSKSAGSFPLDSMPPQGAKKSFLTEDSVVLPYISPYDQPLMAGAQTK